MVGSFTVLMVRMQQVTPAAGHLAAGPHPPATGHLPPPGHPAMVEVSNGHHTLASALVIIAFTGVTGQLPSPHGGNVRVYSVFAMP